MLDILPKLSSLSIPTLYGLLSAVIILCWLLYISGRQILFYIWDRRHVVSGYSLGSRLPHPWRHWVCVSLPRGFQWIDISTYCQALTVVILFAANIVALRLGTDSWHTARIRAGSLAIIHMAPLCLGINFSFPADVLHIDRQTLAWFHRWNGHICVLHSLLHGSLVVSAVRQSMPANPNYIITTLVCR